MALIDVVKCPMQDNELCIKFPSEDLRLGSQLVVYSTQKAFFVKGGIIYDEFGAGTYTLQTSNIPLLTNVISLPFGGDSPFQAEVWFVNQTSKLDMKWGTPTPIQLEDPKYNIILPVRAYGQYGIRVDNPRLFLQTLIGNMSSFSAEKVDSYFKGKLLSHLSAAIANKMANDNMSILDINTHLVEMSNYCNEAINTHFSKYGLELQDFSIISINIPSDDSTLVKLKEAKDLAARLNIVGRDVYQMERSFDVLDSAASNNGTGGQVIGMGVGIGVGAMANNQLGNMAGQLVYANPIAPPPLPQSITYHVYINGQQIGGQTISMIQQLLAQGRMNSDTLVWRPGMSGWVCASQCAELAQLFVVPPITPQA